MLLKKTGLKKLSWKCSKALPMHVNLTWKVRGSKGRTTKAWKSLKFKIVPPATQIAPNVGDAQTAVAGAAVATAPSVVVKDAYNYPVSGVSVTFAVASGGGSVSGPTATTNAAGIATVGGWTLGTHAGPNTLTATSASLTGSPVTFNATGEAGPVDAAQSTITTTSTTVTADGTSNQIITVTARDANGNPLTGGDAVVTITQLSGTATIGTVVNNGDGTYSVTVTAPTTSGTSIFAATLGGGAVDGGGASQALITVNYVAGPAAQIALNAGDAQTAVAGIAVATAPSVIVTDAHDNPVSGASVTFAVTAGGGGIAGGPTVTTDASGIATVGGWTLGTTAGANTLMATCDGLTGSPVNFNATGTAGAADATQSTLTPTSASITADGSSTQNVTVQAEDAYGNDLTTGSAIVTISQLSGTGMIGPVVNNGDGTYTATVTAPTATGSGVFVATLNGDPVQNGTASQAQATVSYVAGPLDHFGFATGSGPQTAGSPFTVTVTAYDAYGNLETGYAGPATLSASSGAGTVSPTSIDFVNGVATPDVTLTKAGDGVSLVVSDGLVSSDSGGSISVSPAAPDAANAMLTPTSASITADGSSTQNVTVQAEDAYGNDLTTGSAIVTISQLSGTGMIGPVVNNGDGTYTATVTAPTATGSGVFVATLNGDPVQNGTASQAQATVSYVAGPLDHFGFATGSGPQTAGSPFTVTVTAYDAYGNLETGYAGPATLSASSGAGTVSPTSIDFVNGVATPDVTLTKAGDGVSLVVSDGLVSSDSGGSISVSPAAPDAANAMLTPTSASITADGSSTPERHRAGRGCLRQRPHHRQRHRDHQPALRHRHDRPRGQQR